MKLDEMTVRAFTEELASNSPAPGGGSVAALCGALAASLSEMVSNLTVGKEKFAASEDAMQEVLKASEDLRVKFVKLINDDTDAFNLYAAALKMPKDTDEAKAARRAALAEAAVKATEIPLATLKTSAEAAKLAYTAARYGNPNAASDAGCAAQLAEAAAVCASYNVKINLSGIKDAAKAEFFKSEMEEALKITADFADKTRAVMKEQLG